MLRDKKILITGLTGNLAGSIAVALAGDNEVWGYARFTRDGQQRYWDDAGVHTVVGNYADGDFTGVPADFDYVIHCAVNVAPDSFDDGMRDNAVGSALLMAHCRSAKAFLHVSATAIYGEHPDPEHLLNEGDFAGSSNMGHYNGTKLAAEGAVQAMAVHLGLPTIICRLGVQYGLFHRGGLPGIFLEMILNDETIVLPAGHGNRHMIISDDDVVRFLEPLLAAASVPPVTVNLGGDVAVPVADIVAHFAELSGKTPRIEYSEALTYPSALLDPARRIAITGPCQVEWRDGLTRQFEALAPGLRHPAEA